ncbi:MAG: hypothetical protein Q8Q84_27115, partial [Hydrogenophaga sp.]|nr:hypothetical protein [Hydrogenophaga sp.]
MVGWLLPSWRAAAIKLPCSYAAKKAGISCQLNRGPFIFEYLLPVFMPLCSMQRHPTMTFKPLGGLNCTKDLRCKEDNGSASQAVVWCWRPAPV